VVLSPAEKLDLKQLVRTFTLRTSEGFVENFGPDLIARVGEEAPRVRLRFVQKPDKDSTPLRDGTVDLETGVVGETTGPEVRVQALFRGPFHWRGANGAQAEPGRDHALPLCGQQAHLRFAAGARQGAD
jgi:DNA-binding transcriptional LysR family regulator